MDNKVKKLFTEEAETPYKRDYLVQLLSELQEQEMLKKNVQLQKQVEVIRSERTDYKHWSIPEKMDEVEKSLWLQWKPLYDEMNHLQTSIYEVAKAGAKNVQKAQEACKMAHRILDLDKLCDSFYEKRNFYKEHHRLPDEPEQQQLVVDPIKLPLKLANAERYVREYKNQLRKDPANTKAAKNLKKWELRVLEFKKALKID